MSLWIIWLSAGILFLIVEFLTATFYGFALSVAAFVVALYVYTTKEMNFTIIQGLIFAGISLVASYFFPKWLSPKTEDKPQGLDIYIGEVHKVQMHGDEIKITLNGVEYLAQSDENIAE